MPLCCKRARRPNWPAKWRQAVYYRVGNPFKIGHCWHCGIRLSLEKSNVNGDWHIDHWPVPYREIDGQCCIGVTDPLDINNLVPSCVKCNVSHKYERRYFIYCGRSQFYSQLWCWIMISIVICVLSYWYYECVYKPKVGGFWYLFTNDKCNKYFSL